VAFSAQEFGADMRLLGDLQFQNDRNPGNDLFTIERPKTGTGKLVDLALLSGTDNLKQALLLRFLTPMGELAQLGHPDYGSRLSELIGQLNNQANRNLAKMYVLQALAGEPRVQQVLNVTVTQNGAHREQMDISVSLQAINATTPLNFVFPFFLQGGS
jgi:phage baseplate assembly protein W